MRPDHVTIRRSRDPVRWHALDTRATIWFPTGQPFGSTTRSVESWESVASGLARRKGRFAYGVDCASGKRFAVSNSDPEVIVRK